MPNIERTKTKFAQINIFESQVNNDTGGGILIFQFLSFCRGKFIPANDMSHLFGVTITDEILSSKFLAIFGLHTDYSVIFYIDFRHWSLEVYMTAIMVSNELG